MYNKTYQQTGDHMKLSTVLNKLGHFKSVQDKNGNTIFYSRSTDARVNNRIVKVVNQDSGNCVALPILESSQGEQDVIFHAKTVKSLVQFLEGK